MKKLVELLKDLQLVGFTKRVDSTGRIYLEAKSARLTINVENGKIEWSKGADLENGLMNKVIICWEHRELELNDQVEHIRGWVEDMGIELFEHEV